jgi:hypothetical protein
LHRGKTLEVGGVCRNTYSPGTYTCGRPAGAARHVNLLVTDTDGTKSGDQ